MKNFKEEEIKRLGEYIKNKRIIKNISAYQIEKTYGIDRSLWSKLENGKQKSLPKPEFLMQIAKILEINYVELYVVVGYITTKSIVEYFSDSHRIREKDKRGNNFKP